MKNVFFLVLGLTIIFGSIFLFLNQPVNRSAGTKDLRINDVLFKVEIADTPEKREQGLSGKTSLLEGSGMLFIFETADMYGFWMKDMNFPIDILWIDENLNVVDITRDLKPETYPEVFYPNKPVKYVLELPSGAVEKYRIEIGAVIQ